VHTTHFDNVVRVKNRLVSLLQQPEKLVFISQK
jgi:hypothetical protein